MVLRDLIHAHYSPSRYNHSLRAIIEILRRSKPMVQISRRYKILFLIIFFLSVDLRLGMVSFNREANDDHMQVISLIIKSGTLPNKSDCWECYQPKLFHYTAAKILQLTGQA
jgi:hypothetical protein